MKTDVEFMNRTGYTGTQSAENKKIGRALK